MKMNSRLSLPVLFSVALSLVSCPQSGTGSTSPHSGATPAVSSSTGVEEALVFFTCGEVAARGSGDWTPVRAGDRVGRGQSVRTGVKSACELQCGNLASIRLEADTEISFEEMTLRMGEGRVSLSAASGSVLSKVEKLSGAERFRVKTRTAICGVRGTEFGVTVTGTGDTVLSVREGRVAAASAAFDPDAPPAELQGDDTAVREARETLAGAERLVDPGRTVAVTAAHLAAAEATVRTVATAAGTMLPAGEQSKFTKLVIRAANDLQENTAVPRSQNAEQKELLKRFDGLKRRMIKNLTVRAAGEEEAAVPAVKYYAVGIIARPADAQIYLGNEYLGIGRFEGLFSEGVNLTFSVRKPGWRPGELSLTVEPDTAKTYELAVQEPDAFTETFINPNVSGSFESRTSSGEVIEVALGKQRTLINAGAQGLEFFPNSATVLLSRKPFRVLMSAYDETYLLEGKDLFTLTGPRPVLTRGGGGSIDNGRISIGGVYTHADGRLYAFYHAWDYEGFEKEVRIETESSLMWYSRIAVAVSEDGGMTWKKMGPVVESNRPKEWRSYEGQTTRGVAEASVVPDKSGRYLYLYYTEYARDGRPVTIGVARADTAAGPPLPGTFKKYRNGAFTEDARGGNDTPLVNMQHLDEADVVEPFVFYSKTLNQYVMVFMINLWKEFVLKRGLDKSGIYLAYSQDGIIWSKPSRLVKDWTFPTEGGSVSYAPGVILDEGSDTQGWLVFAYSPRFGGRDKGLVPTHLAGRRISFTQR